MTPELRSRIPPDLFKSTTTSYKYFWAISILELIKLTGRTAYELRFILSRMVADAALVLNDNNTIRLGGADYFRVSYGSLKRNYPDAFDTNNGLFSLLLREKDTKLIKRIVDYYSPYVPYRFLTPWVGTSFNRPDLSDEEIMFGIDAPYVIEALTTYKEVRLNPTWVKLVTGCEDELIGLVVDKLGSYIEARNNGLSDNYLTNIKNLLIAQDSCILPTETINVLNHQYFEPDCAIVGVPLDEREKKTATIVKEEDYTILDNKPIVEASGIVDKETPEEMVRDEIVDGKVVSVRNRELLKKILPIINTDKLTVISILMDFFEAEYGVKMTFLDACNLLERTQIEHNNEIPNINFFSSDRVPFNEEKSNNKIVTACLDRPQSTLKRRAKRIWLVPSNSHFFDLYGCFKKFGCVYWRQCFTFREGDVVYLYCTAPTSAIRFKAIVDGNDLPFSSEMEREKEFYINPDDFDKKKDHNRMALFTYVATTHSSKLGLNNLLRHGMNAAPQGVINLTLPRYANLLKYISDNF